MSLKHLHMTTKHIINFNNWSIQYTFELNWWNHIQISSSYLSSNLFMEYYKTKWILLNFKMQRAFSLFLFEIMRIETCYSLKYISSSNGFSLQLRKLLKFNSSFQAEKNNSATNWDRYALIIFMWNSQNKLKSLYLISHKRMMWIKLFRVQKLSMTRTLYLWFITRVIVSFLWFSGLIFSHFWIETVFKMLCKFSFHSKSFPCGIFFFALSPYELNSIADIFFLISFSVFQEGNVKLKKESSYLYSRIFYESKLNLNIYKTKQFTLKNVLFLSFL